jgi:hypothetical protein
MGMGMGMGMGGMYGGMNGQQGEGFLQRFSQYMFAFTDVAQMLEYNAHGLAAFYQIMKTVISKSISFCSTTLITFVRWLWQKILLFKQWSR